MTEEEKGTLVGALAVQYARHPGLKALLNLLPGGGSADGLLQTRADEINRQRLRDFFEELAKGNTPITAELVQSDDFLHCYFKTTEAVQKTRRKEKIELFARMLSTALDAQIFAGVEQYEELLDSLDSMSLREFLVLRMLKDYEVASASKSFENDVARIRSYWTDFVANACRSFEIEEQEFDPFMERLQRTGFFTRNTGAFWDDDPRIGKTTRQFGKLCEIVGTH